MEGLCKTGVALLVHVKLVDWTTCCHRCSIEEICMLLFGHYLDGIGKTLAECGRAFVE